MEVTIIAHLSAVSHVLPAYAGIRHRRKMPFPMKVFTAFLIFGVAFEAAEYILKQLNIHNIFLINFYGLIEFECLIYLYFQRVEKGIYKDILQLAGMLYFLLWMFDVSFDPFPKNFNESIMAGGNALLIALSILVLNNTFSETQKELADYSIFWIGIGAIIYCAGTIIVFTMSNKILAMGLNYFILLWHINWILTIVANLLFTRSFWCKAF